MTMRVLWFVLAMVLAGCTAQRCVVPTTDTGEVGYIFGPLKFEGRCLALIATGPSQNGTWVAAHQRFEVAPVADCPESF